MIKRSLWILAAIASIERATARNVYVFGEEDATVLNVGPGQQVVMTESPEGRITFSATDGSAPTVTHGAPSTQPSGAGTSNVSVPVYTPSSGEVAQSSGPNPLQGPVATAGQYQNQGQYVPPTFAAGTPSPATTTGSGAGKGTDGKGGDKSGDKKEKKDGDKKKDSSSKSSSGKKKNGVGSYAAGIGTILAIVCTLAM